MTHLAVLLLLAQAPQTPTQEFLEYAAHISAASIRALPVQDKGRIKPVDTLARETMLFLAGRRDALGLTPIQAYLGYVTYRGNDVLEIIEVRNKDVREQLGFPPDKRFYSVRSLDKAGIEAFARPLISKEREHPRSLTGIERGGLEALRQYQLARELISGDHFLSAVDSTPAVRSLARQYLTTLQSQPASADAVGLALENASPSKSGRLELEVALNHLRPFRWAGILYALLALVLVSGSSRHVKPPLLAVACAPALSLNAAGLVVRGVLMGFVPVTNMYSSILWAALVTGLLGLAVLLASKNERGAGLAFMGSAAFLLLAEASPLTLSADLDVLPAVLRSNYWLALHVLTVTGAYAAFTLGMLVANAALLRSLIRPGPGAPAEVEARSAWRMSQVGVCLMAAGIIFGGIWASSAWGRWWGWDPKEVWALLVEVGFGGIFYARQAGRLSPFGILVATPAAYLLVVMAWYGVNGPFAAGLHSYGSLPAGALFVSVFVSLQVILLVAAAATSRSSHWMRAGSSADSGDRNPPGSSL